MQNDQPQQPLLLTHILAIIVMAFLASVVGTCRFLMITFTQLNNCKKEDKHKEIDQLRQSDWLTNQYLNEMKHVYHMLLAILYLVYYAAAVTLPLLLLSYFPTFLALALSFTLVFLFGEILPRAYLRSFSPLSILVRWGWVITFTKLINRLIPLNGTLKKMFITEIVHHNSTHPFITKDNIHRLLGLTGKPVRQEEVELLEKLRLLGHNPTSSLMIPKCNIFILDLQSELTMRSINHLSKYYFTKILVYSGTRDNVIGYMQFKQLLAFQLNQRISVHKEVICTQLVRLHAKDSLAVAIERMIEAKVNFALVFEGKSLLGLVKLKDIFARLLLKWYNYEGLNAERSFNSISSMISLGRDYRCNLQEGVEQH